MTSGLPTRLLVLWMATLLFGFEHYRAAMDGLDGGWMQQAFAS
jgi:hypothetical protein